jgi:hypothetical protein
MLLEGFTTIPSTYRLGKIHLDSFNLLPQSINNLTKILHAEMVLYSKQIVATQFLIPLMGILVNIDNNKLSI